MASLDHEGNPDTAKRNQRQDEGPQPQFSTGWHYQDGFGLESPCL